MVNPAEVVETTKDLARFGKFKEAEAYLAKVRREDPSCFEAELEQIRIALFQDKVADAYKLIAEAAKKAPNDPRLVGLQGVWFIETKDYKAAAAALSWVLERDPYDGIAALNLGIAYRHLGQIHESEGALLKSLSLNPLSELAHYEYSRILTLKGRYEDAMQEVLKAIRINPYFIIAYMTLTEYLRAVKRLDIAVKTYEIAIKVAPDVDFFYGQLANLHEEMGDYASALKYVEHLAAKGNNFMDYVKMGIYKTMLRDFTGAETAFKKAMALGPDRWQPLYDYGELKFIQNDLEGAKQYYEKALPLVKNQDSRPYNALGLVLMYQSDFVKAEPLFHRAIQINPNDPAPYMNLAVLWRNKKDFTKARDWAQKAVPLAANDAQMSEKIQGILASLPPASSGTSKAAPPAKKK